MADPAELTKAKEPFVMRDYVSSFDGATRNMNAITTIRNWQLTAVAGLTLFTKPLPWYAALGVVLFAWIAFVLLECNEQLFLEIANDHIVDCEKRLGAKSVDEWRVAVRDWSYGGGVAQDVTRGGRWRAAFGMLRKNGVWPWQAVVLLAFVGGFLLRSYLPVPGKP